MKKTFWFLVAVVAAIHTTACSAGLRLHGQDNSPFNLVEKIGGGGWLVGSDISPNGQRIVRTDTYGAYLWDGSKWNQLLTQARLPAADFGYYPPGSSQIDQNSGGVYEIQSAPSNDAIIYMYISTKLFVSTNHGVSFTNTGFTHTNSNNPNGGNRMNGRKMAVDPFNPDHVYLGTDQDGMFETVNGTHQPTATFTAVSAIPTANSVGSGGVEWPNYRIAFDPDPAAGHNCRGTLSCKAYVHYYHQTAGTLDGTVQKTSDGGTTWGLAAASGPTSVDHMIVAPTGGTVWLTDSTQSLAGNFSTDNVSGGVGGHLWKLPSGGAWSQFSGVSGLSDACHAVAINPNLATNIICVNQSGGVGQSNSTGASWTNSGYSITSTDVPWLAQSAGALFMSIGDAIFDPSLSNTYMAGAGVGVWTAQLTPASPALAAYNSATIGIEQVVSQAGIAPNGVLVAATQDRSTWYLNTPNSYPTQTNSYHTYLPLSVAWSISAAPGNSNFMTFIGSPSAFGVPTGNVSGYSADGGATWHQHASYDKVYANAALSCPASHPMFTLTAGDTAGMTTWANGAGTIVRVISQGSANNLFFPVTVSGNTITLQSSDCASATNTSLPMAAANYEILIPTEPLNNRNGRLLVSNVTSGTAGAMRVTVSDLQSDENANDLWCISGVVGTGFTGANNPNGCWVVSSSDNATWVELFGSTFAGTYTSGGTGIKTLAWGGDTATASSTNFVLLPGNKNYPLCTINAGSTWTEMKFPAGLSPGDISTGWDDKIFLRSHALTVDSAGTFFGYNFLQGVYKWTACNTPTLHSDANLGSGSSLFSAFNATLLNAPGHVGNLFFTAGPQGNPGTAHPGATKLWRSLDGSGDTWVALTGPQEPEWISFGAVAPGHTYPTLYMVGWIDQGAGPIFGTWRSLDADQTTPTWTKVGDYPLGSMDAQWVLVADGVTWNKWYIGWGGSGWSQNLN